LIINITGQAGSGKTTIATHLVNLIDNSILIDGDELREIFINKWRKDPTNFLTKN
jgi:ABC-type multidrug transport system fused ATPase/permease subunit